MEAEDFSVLKCLPLPFPLRIPERQVKVRAGGDHSYKMREFNKIGEYGRRVCLDSLRVGFALCDWLVVISPRMDFRHLARSWHADVLPPLFDCWDFKSQDRRVYIRTMRHIHTSIMIPKDKIHKVTWKC